MSATGMLAARLLVAATAGAAMSASFPPADQWWTAPLAMTLLTICLAPMRGNTPTIRQGAAIGFVFGFSFFALLLPWVGLYVGSYASWLLSAVEAVYLAGFGAGAVAILRAGATRQGRSEWHTVIALWGFAGWWSLWEWVRSSWPWGGFPWGRIAFGQADGPLLPLAAWGGVPILGLIVVLIGCGIAMVVIEWINRDRGTHSLGQRLTAVAATLLLALGGTTVAHLAAPTPPSPGETGRDLNIAVVQGNVPRLGLDFAAQRRAVLNNHVSATMGLVQDVADGQRPQPDIVVWPENASDVPALSDNEAAQAITDASEAVDAPVLVGTIDRSEDGVHAYNTYLVWDGTTGPVDRHDKHYIQPFGEWLPLRGLIERIAPIARTAGHFIPGDGDGVVRAADTDLAIATCFEVAFDPAVREPVSRGAQIVVVPTNNATFGRSPMTYQQLAMSRVRAVEHRVPVIISATSGVSAVIAPDGTVLQETGIFEPAVLSATVPLDITGTLTTRLGDTPQLLCALFGLIGLLWALRRRRGAVAV